MLALTCQRNTGDVCLYTCDYSYCATYHPRNQTAITCNSSSNWDALFSLLCENIVCPSSISNGYTCCLKNNYKDHCNSYFCNSGYQPASNYHSLECDYDGEWEWTNPSPLKFCLGEKELCPRNIQGGWLSYECHRHEGGTCFFYCNECRNYTAPTWLTCLNKTWDSDTEYLCTHCSTRTPITTATVRCPLTIPGGSVYSTCDRTPLTTCGYFCNNGCTKRLTSLLCNSYQDYGESRHVFVTVITRRQPRT